jgi:hypothetical protein
MNESPCIYCLKDASSAKGKEHVIPEALGCKETLPQGYVCDSCNSYFGTSVDRSVVNNRMIALTLLADQIPGKTGKPRNNFGTRLYASPDGYIAIMLGPATITHGTTQVDFKLGNL